MLRPRSRRGAPLLPRARSRAGRALRHLGAAAVLLAGLAAGGVSLFLARPAVLVNARAAAWLLRRSGWSPRWSRLTVSARALGASRHRYAAAFEGFCFEDPAGAASGCFRELAGGAVVEWSRRGPRLISAGLRARGEQLRLEPARLPPRRDGRLPRPAPFSVEELDLDLPLAQLVLPGLTVTGHAALRLDKTRRLPWRLAADVRLRDGSGARRLRLDAEGGGVPAPGRLPDRGELRASGTLDGAPFRAGLRAGALPGVAELVFEARSGPRRAGGRWRARRSPGGWSLEGELDAASPAVHGGLRDCRGRASAGLPGFAALDCRWTAELAPLEGARVGVPPLSGTIRLAGRLQAARRGAPFSARAGAELSSVKGLEALRASAGGRVSGLLGDGASLAHEASVEVDAPRFEELVVRAAGTRWAAPAPFHVLKGPVSARAAFRGDPRSRERRVDWSASADLASRRQRLKAKAWGAVRAAGPGGPARRLEGEATLRLSDAAFELPRLDIRALPQPVVDRRIRPAGSAVPERAGAGPRWRLRVLTERPVRLLSNLASDPVPVSLDLALGSPPALASGTVTVGRFGARLFRRSAQLERLRLLLAPGGGSPELDGLVRCRAAEADIRILLLGTAQKPRIELESDPPMERDEIIALLVYGKSPSELDLDEAQSVGNTRTALESKAFGLASLYLFGTTPIETVTYDAASRAYAVKFRLPGAASMELSSDFSSTRELRLRKLLAPHWVVQSELQSRRLETGQESGAGAAWLEWFDRY